MCIIKIAKIAVFLGLAFAVPLAAQEQQKSGALDEVVSKVINREKQEMEVIRQRAPIVETYIQKVQMTENDGSWQPDGDRYFIGRAEFAKGLQIEPISSREDSAFRRVAANLTRYFSFGTEFLPKGFLQMVYVDADGLERQNYNFDYVRREFLGEVRTLVFDVKPSKKNAKGRFIGRIWVEDQSYTIVRFNGTYGTSRDSNAKFHFDTWRVNAGPDLWLPAFIYSEENAPTFALSKAHTYKAQTRLWGYNVGRASQEQELSQVLVESASPVRDNSVLESDLSPLQQKRAWDMQAQDNFIDKLHELGLIAPKGEIDKVLNTVVNNLEVTNNLDIEPEIRCRVLMTSTVESFTIGRTIVLSRGLVDVLPDEASLAAVLAKEVAYVMLAGKEDTRLAFYDRLLRFDETRPFQHFDFERSPEDNNKATTKAAELLKNSPYEDQLGTAEAFFAELQARSPQIPNLVSPRLGDVGLVKLSVGGAGSAPESSATHIVALPLGGRVKLSPWDDTLELLKSKPVEASTAREKMPFEITPFEIYLTRVGSENAPKTSSQLNIESPEN